MSNLVSVITPAYNCEKTISETIESVIIQTYKNWELIIIDDCSSDGTITIVKNYCKIDSRIRLITMGENAGSAIARNKGIEMAKGRYIALLDSDDMWKPTKLEKQITFMEKNQYAFTFTAYDVFKDSTEKTRRLYEVPNSISYKKYLKNTIIGCLTVIIDREKIQDFHMERGYLEDILTWMYYLKKGVVAYGLNENLASYRIVVGSKSSNKIENAKRYYSCLKEQIELSTFSCIICEFCYAWNAIKKRVFGKIVKI